LILFQHEARSKASLILIVQNEIKVGDVVVLTYVIDLTVSVLFSSLVDELTMGVTRQRDHKQRL